MLWNVHTVTHNRLTDRDIKLKGLNYGSIALTGISRRLMDRLQSVLNAAARLVYNSRKYDRVSPLLHHWLCVSERIKFRLTVLVFHCRNRTAPAYLTRDLHWATDNDSRKRLRSASSHKLIVRRSRLTTAGDRAFVCGMTCLLISFLHSLCLFSRNV